MRDGVLYARTEEGEELPVIDVTNPAFAVEATEAELEGKAEQFVREAEQWKEIPEALREAWQQSKLAKALMAAAGTFLDGMSTYQFKLGPENLGADATAMDMKIAASFPAFSTRLRLQDMARLLAEGLRSGLGTAPRRPVCLVNIAGGAAADSWNALIVLRAGIRLEAKARHDGEQPDQLEGRKIVIAVLDQDHRGPSFGRRAIEALCGIGAPLNGLDVAFQQFAYKWAGTGRLREILEELNAGDAVCGVSSEGGLFEYGSDEEIVANLETIYAGTAADVFVIGSVTRDAGQTRATDGARRIATRPRTMEAFASLAGQRRWKVQEVLKRPFSYNVRLVKA
jgi:hypothetical protein